MAKLTVSELCAVARIREMFKDQAKNMERMLLDIMNYTRREWERFMALGSDNGDPNLMMKTFLICYEYAYPLVSQDLPQLPEAQRQMLFRFMSQGAGGILTWWIQDGMKEDPEMVVEYIMRLCIAASDGASCR